MWSVSYTDNVAVWLSVYPEPSRANSGDVGHRQRLAREAPSKTNKRTHRYSCAAPRFTYCCESTRPQARTQYCDDAVGVCAEPYTLPRRRGNLQTCQWYFSHLIVPCLSRIRAALLTYLRAVHATQRRPEARQHDLERRGSHPHALDPFRDCNVWTVRRERQEETIRRVLEPLALVDDQQKQEG